MVEIAHGECNANGIRVHYTRTGGGKPAIVLLHGLLGSGARWTPIARALEPELDVIMPDGRGHGGSSAPLHGYRYEDLADDVVGLIAALGLESPILVGHSMGGLVASVVASRGAPMLRGVVLVDPTFLSPERQREVRDSDVADQHRQMLGLAKADLVMQSRSRNRSLESIELQAEARLQTRMAAFDVLTPPNPDYRALVRAIAVPALLVIGDAPVVTLETATELRQLNPRLRVAQIARAGHGVPFDQPEQLAAAIGSFARELRFFKK
jgi:pimeloyl-ACP methyl ester carboxylesterase